MSIFDAFRALPIKRRVQDELYQAQIDLLQAEAAFEEIKSRRAYLRRRVDRLLSSIHLQENSSCVVAYPFSASLSSEAARPSPESTTPR